VSTAQRYREAVESRDLDAVGELLAPEIVFHSPVTFHPFIGRDTVRRLLGEVIQVFEDFRFTDELTIDGAHALIFRAGVAGSDREIEGIDLLRFDADGLIADFTVMLRPLSALVPFAQAMGERAQAAGLQTTRG
jgi:ketosteroid isomerase-like protein